jgi:hypothetical protein
MNRDWHLAHPMPKNPTEAQRIAWHLEHTANCTCRPIPDRLRERMRELGIPAPEPTPLRAPPRSSGGPVR